MLENANTTHQGQGTSSAIVAATSSTLLSGAMFRAATSLMKGRKRMMPPTPDPPRCESIVALGNILHGTPYHLCRWQSVPYGRMCKRVLLKSSGMQGVYPRYCQRANSPVRTSQCQPPPTSPSPATIAMRLPPCRSTGRVAICPLWSHLRMDNGT